MSNLQSPRVSCQAANASVCTRLVRLPQTLPKCRKFNGLFTLKRKSQASGSGSARAVHLPFTGGALWGGPSCPSDRGKSAGQAMNSGASWNERGLSPELYQAAREAARRAGMSVEEWLDSTFGNGSRPPSRASPRRAKTPPPSLRGARLSDTVAKLNARLEQLTSGRASARHRTQRAGRAEAGAAARTRAARHRSGHRRNRRAPARARRSAGARRRARRACSSPPTRRRAGRARPGLLQSRAPAAPTSRRRSRRCASPSGVEDAIAALRADLADIAHALNEALPRRALEGLQADMHALAERIERSYGARRCLGAARHRAAPRRGARGAQRDDAGRRAWRLRRARLRALAQDGQRRDRLVRSRRCCATSKPRSTSCANSRTASRRPKASRRWPATCRRSARASTTSRRRPARPASTRWRSASTN